MFKSIFKEIIRCFHILKPELNSGFLIEPHAIMYAGYLNRSFLVFDPFHVCLFHEQ